jgi:hypothetical protein
LQHLRVDVAWHGGLEVFQARLDFFARWRRDFVMRFVLGLRRCGLSFVVFWSWVFFFVGHDVFLSQFLP